MRIAALFLCILILSAIIPVNAIEINPSVDTIPFFCKYTLTDWTPLCVRSATQSIIIEGEMNQTFNLTPNMTPGSDFQSSGFLFLNGSRPMEGNLNMSMYNITVNNITGRSDVVNKSYVDALLGNDQTWNASYYLNDASRGLTGTDIFRAGVSNDRLFIQGGNTTVGSSARIALRGADYTSSPGSLSLYVPNAARTSAVEAIRILGNTNSPMVGIITTAPTATLHVQGTVRFSSYGAGTATFDAGGNITSVSDETKKKNKQKYTIDDPKILDKIEPYSFEYTYESGLDSTSRYYGFLAQNLESAGLSECVYTTNGTKTVYDRCISAYQMNVIKNQSEQIDSLTKRIEDLEKKP
ncbi:MAG: tail fiber domain-containing protein [Candidatus Micrarchaeia archaeon]